jgi:hypothetical protein
LAGDRRRSIGAEAPVSRRQLVALRVVWPFPQAPPFCRSSGADSGQLGSRDDHVSISWPSLSFKDACRFARSLSSPSGPCGPSGLVRTPLVGFKDRPSASTNAVRPLPGGPKPAFRPGSASLQTRSALVVPPDSDGFLRSAPCRSIAPCNRPWGSPCFWCLAPLLPESGSVVWLLSRWRMPFEAFPSLVAVPCHHGLCPLAVGCRFREPSPRVAVRFRFVFPAPPTSGLCSTRESVATVPALPPRLRSLLPWAWILSDCDAASRAFEPRRAESASAFTVTPEGVTGPTPATGLPVRRHWALRRVPMVLCWAPQVPRRVPWVLGRAPMPSNPVGPANRPSEEGWLRRAREGPPHRPSEEGWIGGSWGTRLVEPSLRGGGGKTCAPLVPRPRRGLVPAKPRWSASSPRQASVRSFSAGRRLSEERRAFASR